MKISNLPQGSGQPGATIGNITTDRVSPDKIAAAKAIAAGEVPIRVEQSDTPVDPQVARAQESIRKIKMKTNASPERFETPVEATETPVEPTESAIPDAVEAQATSEETKPLSPQLAALAKQRRALQVKERELADREKALESQKPSNGPEELIAKIKSEPLSVLHEYGVTYEQLTEAILAEQDGSSEIRQLRSEIKALKEGVDKTFVDKDTQAKQAALSEMRREAVMLAREGDAYEMVRETKSIPEVIDLIDRTYTQTGEILDVTEAMELVEKELINESLKIARIKKVQSSLTPAQAQQQQQTKPPIKTLTSRDGARQPMSRRDRAIAAMNGTLKK